MKPEKQPVQINFSGGIDTKTDPKQVILAKFLTLKNSIFDTLGLLRKRNGYESLGTGILSQLSYSFQAFSTNIIAGSFISKYLSELVMGDGKNFYSYSDSDDKWVYKGRLENCSTSLESIYQNQYNNVTADCAINTATGYALYAWESWNAPTSGNGTADPRVNGTLQGVGYSLRDSSTKQEIFIASLSATTSRPRCVAIGNFLYLIYFDSNDNKLHYIAVTSAGGAAAVDLVTNINTTLPNYDVLVNNSLVYVGYNGTGSTVKVASFSSAMASVASVSKAEVASNGIGIFADTSNNIWVAYNNASATKAFIMDSTLVTTVLAATTVDSGATASGVQNVTGIYDGTRGIIFYDQPGLPVLGQQPSDTTLTVTSSMYTQPAVNASVSVPFNNDPSLLNRQLIFITTGGYYFVKGLTASVADSIDIINLGYSGNAAPTTVIATAKAVFPAYGYSNAVVNYNTLTVGGSAGTAAPYLKSVALASRAFLQGGLAHVVVAHDAKLQPTFFLTSLFNMSANAPVNIANITAKMCPSSASGIPRASVLPNPSLDADSVYNIALSQWAVVTEQTQSNIQILSHLNGVVSSAIDLTPSKVSRQELGNVLNVGSGAIQIYDGQNVSEQGFHIYPENITGVVSGSVDAFLGAGTYGYQVVYQWIDAQGQIYQSAPNPVLSFVTTGINNKITLTIPTLRVTSKSSVTIAIFRTVADGSIYYRLDTEYTAYPINNAPLSDSITFVDVTGDNNILGNPQLYTTAEVRDIGPPASSVLSNYKNRLTLVPSENPFSFWYSKQYVAGATPGNTFGIEMSDLFIQNVGTVGGELTCVANLDDKNILFKETSIYYMLGTGPSPSGANNDFTDPIFVTSDCGLVDVTSVVIMPLGLMFKSEKGIFLLDRNLQASYIGAEVESYNSSAVLSAQLIPKSNQVRFLLEGGVMLMYDYFVKQWAVFETLSGISDVIHNNLQVYLDSSGVAHRETPAVYLDGASPVLMSFTTSWVKLAGLQGYQRAFFFYLLAEYLSAHKLSLAISYNFSSSVTQTTVITPNAASSLENWRVFLAQQRCQSFQIALTEVYTGTPGAGFTMSGLNLIVGVKSGWRTISASQSAG